MIPFAAVLPTGVLLPESILVTDAFKILATFSRPRQTSSGQASTGSPRGGRPFSLNRNGRRSLVTPAPAGRRQHPVNDLGRGYYDSQINPERETGNQIRAQLPRPGTCTPSSPQSQSLRPSKFCSGELASTQT